MKNKMCCSHCQKENAALKKLMGELVEALEKINKLERKCDDAWSGGIGEGNMEDFNEIGRISRTVLNKFLPHRKESHKEDCASLVATLNRFKCNCGERK